MPLRLVSVRGRSTAIGCPGQNVVRFASFCLSQPLEPFAGNPQPRVALNWVYGLLCPFAGIFKVRSVFRGIESHSFLKSPAEHLGSSVLMAGCANGDAFLDYFFAAPQRAAPARLIAGAGRDRPGSRSPFRPSRPPSLARPHQFGTPDRPTHWVAGLATKGHWGSFSARRIAGSTVVGWRRDCPARISAPGSFLCRRLTAAPITLHEAAKANGRQPRLCGFWSASTAFRLGRVKRRSRGKA